jgi:hypothetical protein
MLRRQIDDGEEKKEGDHEDAEQISFLENNGSSVSTSLEMIGKKEDKKDGDSMTVIEKIIRSFGQQRKIRLIDLTILISILFGILFLVTKSSSSNISVFASKAKISKNLPVSFSCPAKIIETSGDNDESFEETYGQVSRDMTNDKEEFLKTFRKQDFDGWDQSYTKIKNKSTPFKSKYYPQYLKSGMTIYESACGIGLNLYMTLEILKEKHDISGLVVYGNEYVKESVEKANEVVLSEGVIPTGNKKGIICTSDSTDISHVPSNAFDLVYTGYISPHQDPLDIEDTDDWQRLTDICKTLKDKSKNDWMGQKLWKLVIQKQRDWYGKWVAEMARIAKPGVPVIIEQVSVPYCDNQVSSEANEVNLSMIRT